MRKRDVWVRWLVVLVVVALVAAACGDDDDDDDDAVVDEEPTEEPVEEAAGQDELVIGTLLPESGDLSAIIDSLRTPIDMAVDEINEAGGVLGQDVRIASADDGTDDATTAGSGFDRLVDSVGIPALIGPAASTLTEGLMSQIAAADLVACSGSNTAASLEEELEDNGRYFGFAPNDSLQGPALAEVIAADGYGAVAILVRNDAYGTGFGNAIDEALTASGVDVVMNEAYDPEAPNFVSEVEDIIASGAEAAVVIGFQGDGGQVISDMIERGVGPADFPIYTGDGMQASSFWEQVGDEESVVEGIKGTAPSAAPEGVEHPFQEDFAETGVDTIFSAYMYDCTIAIALATEAAGTTDTEAVIEAMFAIVSGENPCIGFAECKELLDAGETIDLQGASGPLELNEAGHVTSGAYDIWAYDADGEPETLDEPQVVIGR